MISLAGNTPHTLEEVRRVFCIEMDYFRNSLTVLPSTWLEFTFR